MVCEKRTERQFWICGDIHGEVSGLVRNAVNRGISCADIRVVGDFGAGFGRPKSMDVAYGKVRAALERNDICIYTVRGNHDDPAFFDGKHDFERLHFLPDHYIIELCGKKIYPIGGAVSADIDFVDPLTRKSRRMVNDALVRYGSSKRVWWPDEAPVQLAVGSVPSADSTGSSTSSGTLFPECVDIVVSHEAPLSFDPPLVRADYVRDKTWLKILESRKYLDYVLSQVKPALWFYGHYHKHFEGVALRDDASHDSMRQTRYISLDIAEMMRVF
ncbi:metallophosphoesterase [Fibrobacter sp.]|uniref:metallophosphoesterase n=1 Tax=Fibrobacter sp. TaxID=35828 RepID=UPI00262AFE62|nr:metallophosphoesterase [Fibrobacter sp.]MDD7497323.1 metallophosphoesterase [Fibrobacter sp.]MDY5723749.1 metallophosphoesterase [Fibrobacter sp.]